jgi:tetratricopeptide (TPR) repeat protein
LVDLRGIPFAMQALSLALDLAEREPLQRASAAFVVLTAGLFQNPLIEPVLALCRELTRELGTPYARALLRQAEGEAAFFTGNFLAAEFAFERAEQLLLDECIGAHRELAAARNGLALIEYAQKGDFQSQLQRTLAWQADAEARGDVFHANVLRVAHSIVWIARGDPSRARAELRRAAVPLAGRASAYHVGQLLFADVADRYEGRDDAHWRPLQGDVQVLASPAAQTPFLAGYIELHRAWGSIRALAAGRHVRGERELARGAISSLRALGPEVWRSVAHAFEANLCFLEGARDAALDHLQHAERGFRALHMSCLAACARLRHGELAGGSFGERLIAEGQRELQALGVAQPSAWSRAYFSLFEPDSASALTLAGPR